MSKQISALQVSGKVGEVVGMKGFNGENYMRIAKKPSNPNTPKQVQQRSKLVLAGLMSKMTPSELLIGMSSTKRLRRSRYTSAIIRNAIIGTNAKGDVVANLDPTKLVFSEGRFVEVSGLTPTYNGTALSVAYTGTLPEDMASILVIGVIAKNGEYRVVDGDLITKDHTTAVINGTGDTANVYYVPIMRAAGASNVAYANAVAQLATTNDYSVAAEASQAGILDYAASLFGGTETQGA